MKQFEVGKTYAHYVSATIQYPFLCVKRTDTKVSFVRPDTGHRFTKTISHTCGMEVVTGITRAFPRRLCLIASQFYTSSKEE